MDKSGLICDIVDNPGIEVFLFTRPRRFGKSLNLSMIDAFFNLEYKGNTWFDGPAVDSCDRCAEFKNIYPVLCFDLKGLNLGDSGRFDKSVKNRLKELYDRYRYLQGSDGLTPLQKSIYSDVVDDDFRMTDPEDSLKNLCMMLKSHHGKKVILLIDEYDNPIQNSWGTSVQEHVLAFVRDLLGNALKGNDSLMFGVVTGVMQIAKESIFSGLNNLSVNNVFSKNFDERFGFTGEEVKALLDSCGHPEKFPEVKEWYDGYRFGDAEIYNPWSILCYVNEGFTPGTYWAETSGNDIIDTLLENADEQVMDDLRALGAGGTVERDIEPEVVYADLYRDSSSIYSVMVMSGYLNAVPTGDGYALSIPNREMYSVYQKAVLPKGGPGSYRTRIKGLSDALGGNRTELVTEKLGSLLKDVISSKVLDSEHAYQSFLIGVMMRFSGDYRIFGDTLEAGDGFADIRFESLRGNGPHMVVELKRSRSEADLEKDASLALEQIHAKDYAHGLGGRVLLYGIAFHGKTPFILSEELNRGTM